MTSVTAASAVRGGSWVRIPVPVDSMSTRRVLVMERLEGRPVSPIDPTAGTDDRAVLARQLLDCLLRQIMVDGVFHADPHPGNVFLLSDGHLGLLDFGSVGRIDAGMRSALQRLLLAVDHGDPMALTDALLEIVERPDALDEERLRRSLGRFLARHVAAGVTPDASMFTDLFRIVSDHGLAIPPEIAAVFRSLATVEGTISGLEPSFDIVVETRRFAADYLAEQFSPDSLKAAATDELTALLPLLRRLPRRIDRIGEALETGRLNVNMRFLADDRDRRFVTGLLHQILLAFLAAASGSHGRSDPRCPWGTEHDHQRHLVPVPRVLPAGDRRLPRPSGAGDGAQAPQGLNADYVECHGRRAPPSTTPVLAVPYERSSRPLQRHRSAGR